MLQLTTRPAQPQIGKRQGQTDGQRRSVLYGFSKRRLGYLCMSALENRRGHEHNPTNLAIMHTQRTICQQTPSAEIFHQHDLTINLVDASEENPLAIGRNREPSPHALCSIYRADLF